MKVPPLQIDDSVAVVRVHGAWRQGDALFCQHSLETQQCGITADVGISVRVNPEAILQQLADFTTAVERFLKQRTERFVVGTALGTDIDNLDIPPRDRISATSVRQQLAHLLPGPLLPPDPFKLLD